MSDQELEQSRLAYVHQLRERRADSIHQMLERAKRELEDYQAGRTRVPPSYDVLILSGGGDNGAFGAGFLKGWSRVADPNWRMPEFDMVTGVSTGALLAPFAFLGDQESLERASHLYSTPQRDWVRRRGLLFFMPANLSLMRIDGLKRDIAAEFGEETTRRIVEQSDRGRVLAIGTTNLDFGTQRIWDLGAEGRRAIAENQYDRTVDILLASSAIPGAFPAVEIDGHLYADGGITSNILYNASKTSSQGLAALWKRSFPGVEPPKSRIWVIINGQLTGRPEVTQPTWTGVTRASVATAVRSATNTALDHLVVQLELLRALGLPSAEFHFVSIPEDWRPPVAGSFQRETMSALAELGEKMGVDPSSWGTSADRLNREDFSPVLGLDLPMDAPTGSVDGPTADK